MPWQKTSSKLIMKKNILLLLLSTLSINWLSAANTPVYIASAETGIYLSHLDGQTGSLSKPELVSNIGGAGSSPNILLTRICMQRAILKRALAVWRLTKSTVTESW